MKDHEVDLQKLKDLKGKPVSWSQCVVSRGRFSSKAFCKLLVAVQPQTSVLIELKNFIISWNKEIEIFNSSRIFERILYRPHSLYSNSMPFGYFIVLNAEARFHHQGCYGITCFLELGMFISSRLRCSWHALTQCFFKCAFGTWMPPRDFVCEVQDMPKQLRTRWATSVFLCA